jgi:hypothetical protein
MADKQEELRKKYVEEVRTLTEMCADLEKERKHLLFLLVAAALSPLLAFYKPILGGGACAFFVVMFVTGYYFNFVHRNERAQHLEIAKDELDRLGGEEVRQDAHPQEAQAQEG